MKDFKIRTYPDALGSGDNAIEVKLPDQEIVVGTTCEPPEDYEENLEATALYYAIERIAQLEGRLNSLTNAAQCNMADVERLPDAEAKEVLVNLCRTVLNGGSSGD